MLMVNKDEYKGMKCIRVYKGKCKMEFYSFIARLRTVYALHAMAITPLTSIYTFYLCYLRAKITLETRETVYGLAAPTFSHVNDINLDLTLQ